VQTTDLKRLHDHCPAYAFARWSGNPAAIQSTSSAAMDFGTAAHTLLLEGEAVFMARYAIRPDGHDGRTREGKAWNAANFGKEHINAEDLTAIRAMARTINAHPTARLALRGGHPEVTAIHRDSETGLWLKVRPDYLTPALAVNLKTCRDNGKDAFTRQSWSLGYHIGAAMSMDVLRALGRDVPYAFLTVETEPPYIPAVRVLSDELIQAGRLIYRRALRRWADCLSSGRWPGYADDVETLHPTGWMSKEIEFLMLTADTTEQKEAA
jgi:hypothetical protein